MNCPNCQKTLEENARFCLACGLIFIVGATPESKRATAETSETQMKTDPFLGRKLDGRYELIARLGQGGMGTVYRARRIHIGDEVAVKVLHRNYSTEEDVVERFRREAQAAASLRHPNVVTIYDYSETREEALAYIAMEFVPGIPLGYFLKNSNRLSLERAVALMRHICAGVGAAHRRQIVHRDLKPDNIIVVPPSSDNETETVKVVDFGIAKLRDLAAAHTLTQSGMIIGTPFYMSPEQCRGDELDVRSDVYSLGVMFYEMIAGMRPFNAPTPTGVIAKHLTQAPPPLHVSLKIPPAVEAVLMRALAKDPQARQADATAFAAALETAMRQTRVGAEAGKNEPVRNYVPPVVPHAAQAKSHAARNAFIVAVVLLGMLVGSGALLVRRINQTAPSQAISQPEQPAVSPTPNRQTTSTRTLTAGRPNKPTPEVSPKVAKVQPSVTVLHPLTTASRTVPPPTPIGPYKARTKNGQETFTIAPITEHPPTRRSSRRVQFGEGTEQMPPEVRRMLQQMVQEGIPTRQSGGKVKSVIVTRPTN